jgi:indole-3-glycerol phosphate synthase
VISGGDVLTRLVAESSAETERRRSQTSRSDLEQRAARYAPRDFTAALRDPGWAVIAEMKQRTPSMGVLTDAYRPEALAEAYTRGGAAALSVLTQETSFGGSIAHLEAARAHTSLPILRKDFLTDPYQVLEARAAGADAVLLIVAALEPTQLDELLAAAAEQGLAALVEVHDEDEAEAAVGAGAALVGVNHRDLRTFRVDLDLTERLRSMIPKEVVLVAESGIHGQADARRMRAAGAGAILVGERLMRAADPAAAVAELASA